MPSRERTARHNLAVLEKALQLNAAGSAGFKSRPEKGFFALLKGLPEPLVNTHVHGVEPDFHWPEHKLAVEVDGPGHGRPRTLREDALKQQILEAAGYTVVRVPQDDLQRGAVLIRAALAPPRPEPRP